MGDVHPSYNTAKNLQRGADLEAMKKAFELPTALVEEFVSDDIMVVSTTVYYDNKEGDAVWYTDSYFDDNGSYDRYFD